MTVSKVLIVDDEANIRLVLKHALKHEGHQLDEAANGAQALQKLNSIAPSFDLLLLDLRMEPVNGLQVLEAARQLDPDLVVIILTAHGSMESAVQALRLGAFDYLFKPATPETVRQRVQAGLSERKQALKRRQLLSQINTLRQTLNDLPGFETTSTPSALKTRFIRSGQLTIDRHHRQAILAEQSLDLTTAEFDLLLCLALAAPDPLPPRALVNQAMGYDCPETEAREIIKWHIHHLRRKIEPKPGRPRYIKTVRNQGYLWANPIQNPNSAKKSGQFLAEEDLQGFKNLAGLGH